jgi:hypothetical protein
MCPFCAIVALFLPIAAGAAAGDRLLSPFRRLRARVGRLSA